jgi:hypothetical protein
MGWLGASDVVLEVLVGIYIAIDTGLWSITAVL